MQSALNSTKLRKKMFHMEKHVRHIDKYMYLVIFGSFKAKIYRKGKKSKYF